MNDSVKAWVKASRLPSQLYIALPLVLGQVLAAHVSGAPLNLAVFVAVQIFGVLDQLYIVYANDVADEATDATNATYTPFSGGSRVLAESRLTRSALVRAAAICSVAFVCLSAVLAVLRGAPSLVVLAALAVLLLLAYSYPPLRLSYRGGGELLQMLGVGAVLPLYGFAAQRGGIEGFPWALLVMLLPTHLACAIATALPDEPSDRASDKRTLAVTLGGERAATLVGGLGILSVVIAGMAYEDGRLSVPLALSVCVLVLRGARPGSRRMVVRVALAIMSTLSFVAVLIARHA